MVVVAVAVAETNTRSALLSLLALIIRPKVIEALTCTCVRLPGQIVIIITRTFPIGLSRRARRRQWTGGLG